MFTELRLAIYAAVLIAFVGGAWAIVRAHDNGVRAAQNAAYQAAALKATTEARAEEQRRLAAQGAINDESQRLAARARADASALAVASPGLRNALAVACFRAGPSYPPTVTGVASAASEPDLRSDVLGEIEARLRGLAEEADARGIAGASCQASYDSLTKPSISFERLRLGVGNRLN